MMRRDCHRSIFHLLKSPQTPTPLGKPLSYLDTVVIEHKDLTNHPIHVLHRTRIPRLHLKIIPEHTDTLAKGGQPGGSRRIR